MKAIKNKKLVIIVSASILFVAIAFTASSVFQSLLKLNSFKKSNDEKEAKEPCYDHPSLEKTIKEITYNEAFISMAKNDSIGLIVNLSDSTLQLSLQGVIIHSAKIETVSSDGFFNAMDICSYQNLFSSPLEITAQKATVDKEPIVVKKAPKSEAEATAALSVQATDSIKSQKVADVELTVGLGFSIYIYDSSNGCQRADGRVGVKGETLANIKRIFTLKKIKYQPAIHVCVSKDDAVSIYRALPSKAYVVMKI